MSVSATVLENGGEIHFKDAEREITRAERIEILPGGWVKAIYKQKYEIAIYPREDIAGIHTHTEHVENEEWW